MVRKKVFEVDGYNTGSYAKSNKNPTYLSNAIRKYKPENFKIIQLMKCDLNKIDLYEQLFIKTHNTLSPNGYNLQTGGTFTKHSEETCRKRSESLKKLLKDPKKEKNMVKRKIRKNSKK